MQALEERQETRSTQGFSDRLLGAIGGAMFLLAIVAGMASLLGGEPETLAPATFPLVLVSPQNEASADNPVELVFTTPAPLTQTPMGWGTESLHLHAAVNGQDVMPGGSDVTSLGGNRYRWKLRVPGPGAYTLRLFWSGPDHAPIAEGASAPAAVRVEP